MTPAPLNVVPQNAQAWHLLSSEEVLKQLNSNLEGLTKFEAERRLKTNGPNEIKEAKRISSLQILLGQFTSLIVWILIAAGIIAGVLGDLIDAIAIFTIVFFNAAMGFYQELSAEKSIAALKKMSTAQAKVSRDAQIASIPSTNIVQGDILLLEPGDLVSADARLISASSLKCLESALTGESEIVLKNAAILLDEDTALGDRENMIFMGTSVAGGTGLAVVVSIAMQTELGKIAGLIEKSTVDEATPLQQKITSFGRILIWVALGIVTLNFGLGFLRGVEIIELFMTSVGLAVAAVPEGLPAVITVSLSLGVLRMARRGALVRKLAAVETLGSTNIICTDKTGTLTVGEMTAQVLYVAGQIFNVTGRGYSPEGTVIFDGRKVQASDNKHISELASVLVGCNNSHLVNENGTWKIIGDPTEGAFLVAAQKAGVIQTSFEKEMPKQHEIPFDSDRKRSAVIRLLPDGKIRAYVNGAPDNLLHCCTKIYTNTGISEFTETDREHVLSQITAMGKQALRVLGSAYRDITEIPAGNTLVELTAEKIESNLVFVGLTGMYDPPRPEAKDSIAKCHSAGIRVVMITGDNPHTAAAIANELGISSGEDAVTGAQLDKISDQELRQKVSETTVYARVSAEHKLRIISALRANDAVVAMTGDGVNDAPAIKGADIGIAMGKTGTEVTKEAADIIITDDNFATIVAAVEEGRGIYENIRKSLQYLLAGNTGELVLMTFCVLVGLPTPLLPIHLLWINLVTDGLPALCLATDKVDPEVMKNAPRKRSENMTDASFLRVMAFTGFLTAGVGFAVYFFMLKHGTTDTARSYVFTVIVIAELLRSFGARSEKISVWKISVFSNINLLVVVVLSLGFQFLSHNNLILGSFLKSSNISLWDLFLLFVMGSIPFLVNEIMKLRRL